MKSDPIFLPLILPYSRSKLKAGALFQSFLYNKSFQKNLDNANEVIFFLYGTPIGDSLLFLSVFQACIDYLFLTRSNNLPKLIVDNKFESLLSHLKIFQNAEFIEDSLVYFKEKIKYSDKVVLICDDKNNTDPDTSIIFNTENKNYLLPPFRYEAVFPPFFEYVDNKIVNSYISRPSKHYLLFEMALGVVLHSNPNESLPSFIFPQSKKLDNKALKVFDIDINNNAKFYVFISLASGVEKKFGTLRFIKLAKKIILKNPNAQILILATKKEESPGEWLALKKSLINYKKNIRIINAEDLELLGYILSRSELIIGNDTGFSHLGAMSKKDSISPLVNTFILYSNHDYGKWSTGKANVFPITTKVSRYLRKTDTDGLSIPDDPAWGFSQWAYSIKIDQVYRRIDKYIKKEI